MHNLYVLIKSVSFRTAPFEITTKAFQVFQVTLYEYPCGFHTKLLHKPYLRLDPTIWGMNEPNSPPIYLSSQLSYKKIHRENWVWL